MAINIMRKSPEELDGLTIKLKDGSEIPLTQIREWLNNYDVVKPGTLCWRGNGFSKGCSASVKKSRETQNLN